jgi:hypothetical protein
MGAAHERSRWAVPIEAGGADASSGYFRDRVLGSLPTCIQVKANAHSGVQCSQSNMQSMRISQNEGDCCRILSLPQESWGSHAMPSSASLERASDPSVPAASGVPRLRNLGAADMHLSIGGRASTLH